MTCVGVAIAATSAQSADITLTDGSSTVKISPDTQAGIYDYTVSGANQVDQKWYWLEVGGSRFSLDVLGTPTVNLTDNNKALTTYTDVANGYSISIDYELTGSDFASGQSLLKELVSIQNTSGSALDISVFWYNDFDLGGTAADDSASLWGFNDSDFLFGDTKGWNNTSQSDSGNAVNSIYNFTPLLGELGFDTVILDKLDNTLTPLVSDATIVLTPTSFAPAIEEFGPLGPGDVAHAIQYDFNIAAGSGAGFGVDNNLDVTPIPEPTTAALSLLGLAALLTTLRSRKV